MPQLFVYGTLQRGQCRHATIADQKLIGRVRTSPNFRLYDVGDYPGMIPCDEGRNVPGELYEVDENCLKKLDAIEAVDEGLYRRSNIRVFAQQSSSPESELLVVSYIYLLPIRGHREISQWPLKFLTNDS